jgi:type IV protein arginine methyltransferase
MSELEEDLITAATDGDTSQVRDLITQNANVAYQDGQGVSALMLAAENGHIEIVRLLLDAGAPWNAQDSEGYCAGKRLFGICPLPLARDVLD